MKHIIKYPILFCSAILLLWSCKKDSKSDEPKPAETGPIQIYFNTLAIVNDTAVGLGLETYTAGSADSVSSFNEYVYTNAKGTKITLNEVRYWVSNIVLTDVNGKTFTEPNSYHLIEYLPTSTKENLTITGVPAGSYSGISFSIGVDKAHNHDLTQKAGELSETIGMSWDWNTGYIFFKTDGRFLNNNGKYENYIYHVGTDDAYKTLSYDFPEDAIVAPANLPVVHFGVNVLGLFGLTSNAQSNITDLNASSNSMMDLTLQTQIAKNYGLKDVVFSLEHIHPIRDDD